MKPPASTSLAREPRRAPPRTGEPRRAPTRPGPIVDGLPTSLEVREGGSGLDRLLPDWEELAARSLEPNVFYEAPLLRPALRHLAEGATLEVWLVWAHREGDPPRLCALLPVERRRGYRGLPVAIAAPWKHVHCFLCTPLLDRELADAGAAGLLAHAAEAGVALFEWRAVGARGQFQAVLERAAQRAGRALRATEGHERALFLPARDAEAHLRAAQPRHHRRKELRRLMRRLREQGEVALHALAPGEDPAPWIRDFLALEASGWKGGTGTAIARRPEERAWFETAARECAEAGQLRMLALELDGRPVAMKCNFLARGSGGAGRCGFAFKIAHDEAFARFSPGLLLEHEHGVHLHEEGEVAWMDSCAQPGHPMIERLWPDRRAIATLLSDAGSLRGRGIVAAQPLLRGLLRALRGRRAGPPDSAPPEEPQ